jgi:exonuclease SbcC
MLNLLRVKDSFCHKNVNYSFEKGLTAISGLNGKGKSELIDIIQWCLWGVKALRGDASDYDHYAAELYFTVRGVEYAVIRSKNNAHLIRGDDSLARGTKPVNQKIEAIFGYSYEVFKMANVSRQGEAQMLCDMLPTERKRAIDNVIGLNRLDNVSKWAKERRDTHRVAASTLERFLVQPDPVSAVDVPVQTPEQLLALASEADTKHGIWKALKAVKCPVEVRLFTSLHDLNTLREQQAKRLDGLAAIKALEDTLKSFPQAVEKVLPHPWVDELTALKNDLKVLQGRKMQQASLSRELQLMPFTTLTQEDVDQHRAAISLWEKFERKQKLIKQQVEHHCPNCKHVWHDQPAELAELSDVPDEMDKPEYTVQALAKVELAVSQAPARAELIKKVAELEVLTALLIDPTATIQAIEAQQELYNKYLAFAAVEAKAAEVRQHLDVLTFNLPSDVSSKIKEGELNHKVYAEYLTEKRAYEQAQAALKEHPENGYAEESAEFSRLWTVAQKYLLDVQSYQTKLAQYEQAVVEHVQEKAQEGHWSNVMESILAMRQKVKSQLIPSLASVASSLLSAMSGGWLSKVEISEDFEIAIDGKKVHKLSGAGKDLSNMALRIALGLVLTNNVFPVLMLDEVDQGIDREKAPLLAEALKRLTTSIGQIIQISHKAGLVADHRIEL